jgi:ankyrin repeat protein
LEPELITAVKRADAATVRSLLAQKVDVNATDATGSTALHVAAQKDNAEIAGMLIASGANVNAKSRYNVTPMSLAATNGNAALIERLLKAGVDANSVSGDEQTALMTAARNGNVDAIKMLLTHGADVNTVEAFKGQTALMWAAGEGNAAATELLIEFGANVNAKSKGGFTPFLFAVMNDRIKAAEILLDHGANIEDKAPDGSPALSMAVINAYYDLAAVLAKRGAKLDPPGDPNGSPLHSLVWLHKPGTSWEAAATASDPLTVPRAEGKLNALQLAKILLDLGADPNARITWKEMRMTKGLGTTKNPPNINLGRHHLSFVGATPFYSAARNGDFAFMRLLVENGADPKLTTAVGVTPLMVAAGLDYYEGETPGPRTGVPEEERLDALKLALELGGDINAHTNFGEYPMIGSAEYTLLTYPVNMDDLLDLGVGDPRWNGMTALHGAVMSNQPSLVQYLVDHGADIEAKNNLGWTPLMITKGIFMANSKKEFPAARAILEKAGARR